MSDFDATIIGSGPNGLAAAIRLAEAGRKVQVLEGSDRIGGGTNYGHRVRLFHDVCSAIHPMAVSSSFFKSIDLKPTD